MKIDKSKVNIGKVIPSIGSMKQNDFEIKAINIASDIKDRSSCVKITKYTAEYCLVTSWTEGLIAVLLVLQYP